MYSSFPSVHHHFALSLFPSTSLSLPLARPCTLSFFLSRERASAPGKAASVCLRFPAALQRRMHLDRLPPTSLDGTIDDHRLSVLGFLRDAVVGRRWWRRGQRRTEEAELISRVRSETKRIMRRNIFIVVPRDFLRKVRASIYLRI